MLAVMLLCWFGVSQCRYTYYIWSHSFALLLCTLYSATTSRHPAAYKQYFASSRVPCVWFLDYRKKFNRILPPTGLARSSFRAPSTRMMDTTRWISKIWTSRRMTFSSVRSIQSLRKKCTCSTAFSETTCTLCVNASAWICTANHRTTAVITEPVQDRTESVRHVSKEMGLTLKWNVWLRRHTNNNNNNNKHICKAKERKVDLYSACRQLPANTPHLPFLRISIR